jgi:hypothetical protein
MKTNNKSNKRSILSLAELAHHPLANIKNIDTSNKPIQNLNEVQDEYKEETTELQIDPVLEIRKGILDNLMSLDITESEVELLLRNSLPKDWPSILASQVKLSCEELMVAAPLQEIEPKKKTPIKDALSTTKKALGEIRDVLHDINRDKTIIDISQTPEFKQDVIDEGNKLIKSMTTPKVPAWAQR